MMGALLAKATPNLENRYGIDVDEVFGRLQVAGYQDSGDNREHTIASLFHAWASIRLSFAIPVRHEHQTMSSGKRAQFAPGYRSPR